MISRLTASAAVFAILATAGLAFTAAAGQGPAMQRRTAPNAMPVITLPTVVITGHRIARSRERADPAAAPAAARAKACIFNTGAAQEAASARQADSLPRRVSRNLGRRCSRYRARYRNE